MEALGDVFLRRNREVEARSHGANKRPRLEPGYEIVGGADDYESVAIKRITPSDEELEEEAAEELLFHEAAFMAACAGVPFVVRFHELVRDLATSECVGPCIGAFLCDQHRLGCWPLPEPTLRAMMWQLLTAAAGIHGRGVVHRDIKP
ncbi:hypothetical protein PR202_gb11578 [Eleusine coracana subsp. coracana]|uniref:Protein kinase domain-containing protein n=1 Tax=Eleusine coracana subsp. coracana TaxID=191504 RepID=A0AAV5EMX2_ELECO|nr:hypothetical protein PR202_gb11578 [Eleusine coracana subsp. coracana]